MNSWNDFMTPCIYLNKNSMYTLPIGLMQIQAAGFKITYGAPLAGAFISCIPIITILAFIGQKYFVKGLMSGAIKG
jgi:ABC-type glycerol-3-phosphate transport system permease component